MAFLQRYSKNPLPTPRIAGALVGAAAAAAAAAAALARFAVPYSIAALSSSVPRLWSSVRFFLVPPYLFITVHLIIVAIWKLSDQKIHKSPADKPADDVKVVDRNVTPSNTVSADIPAESDPVTPISGSKSAESCVTTDSDENSAVSSRFEAFDSRESEADGVGLEDTWQTIVMKKSATWERSSETASVAAEVTGERVVKKSATFNEPTAPVPAPSADSNDELNRRFEAFIKKNYDQIRSY